MPDGRSHNCPRGGAALALPPSPESASPVDGTASIVASLPAHSQMVCMEGVRPFRCSERRLGERLGGFAPAAVSAAITMSLLPSERASKN